jgi:protein-disulfide isomerase
MPFPSSPLRRLVAVVTLAALVVTGLVAASGGGPEPAPVVAAAPTTTLGVPERGGVLGDPRAPLLLTEYADLQCPACRAYAVATLPAVVRDRVRTGRVRLALEPLSFIGPESVRAGRVAAAAQAQGRLWSFVELAYAHQGPENAGTLSEARLRALLRAAGADPARALAAARRPAAAARLARADARAARLGIASTPAFTVRRGDGPTRVLRADPYDAAAFTAALDRELGR